MTANMYRLIQLDVLQGTVRGDSRIQKFEGIGTVVAVCSILEQRTERNFTGFLRDVRTGNNLD
jgi:hypothetical protein